MRAAFLRIQSGRTWLWLLLVAFVSATVFAISPLAAQGQDGILGVEVSSGDQNIICEGLSEEECNQKKEEAAGGEQGSLVEVPQTGQDGETRIFTGERIGFFGVDPRTATAGEYVNLIYKFAIAVLGFFSVAAIVFGGFGYVMSAGNEDAIRKSKDIITGAVTAIVIALLSHLILRTIDPRLVQLTSDFGSTGFDLNEYTDVDNQYPEPIPCTDDTVCEDVVLTIEWQGCSEAAAGIDSRNRVEQKTVCGKKPGQATGFCAVPEGGIERTLSKFAGDCNDKEINSKGVTCAPGFVPRPVADNGAEITGEVIGDDLNAYTVSIKDAFSVFSGYTTFDSETSGLITLDQLRDTDSIDGLLIENVVRNDQGLYFASDAIENHTDPEGNYYVYHKCLPETAAQKKVGSLISPTNAGRAPGGACETDADCGDIERRLFSCSDDAKVTDKVVTSRQFCEAGTCRLREGEFCGAEAIEVCGARRISGRDASVTSGLLAENCQEGTVCLQINDNYSVGDEDYPPPYICAKPGVGNDSGEDVTGFAYERVNRTGSPGDRDERLLGASCDTNDECADFDQDIFECSGQISEYEGNKRVNTVCDTGPGKEHVDSEGVEWDGVCAIKKDSFCRMTGLNCGQRSITERSYADSCVTGTSCQSSRASNESLPELFTCQP